MLLATGQKWFADEEMTPLSWLREAFESSRESMLSLLDPLLHAAQPRPHQTRTDDELAQLCCDELMAALSGNVAPIAQRLSAYGARSARAGTDLRVLSDAIESARRRVVHLLIERYAGTPEKLEGALHVMQRFFDRVLSSITREYLTYRETLTEEQRQREHLERLHSLELEAENQRIQAESRLKSEFLANMSHELRTPLNSIIGFADLLYDCEIPADSPQHREFLGDILRSARHLLKLINDVLDLAKVEAGKMEFTPEETNLPLLVGEVVNVLHTLAVQGDVRIEQAVSGELSQVLVDPARLRQVLYNFLSNAIKFTFTGGCVSIRARPVSETEFRIEVEDTGIGIAPENLDRLFVEFEQLEQHANGRPVGTGLGLALTRRIVEAQGGQVGVHSVLGRGSLFWALLPIPDEAERSERPASYFEELRPTRIVKTRKNRDS